MSKSILFLQIFFYKFYLYVFSIICSNIFIIFGPVLVLLLVLSLSFFNWINFIHFKNFVLMTSLFIFLYYIFIYVMFSFSMSYTFYIQYKTDFLAFSVNKDFSIFGIDNFNIFFLILLSFLFPICILINWNFKMKDFILFVRLASILEIFLILSFTSLNLLLFYIFFEITLFPIFFMINIWGSRVRKVHASYMFFFYTVLGSIFLLLAIVIIYASTGSLNFIIILDAKISFEKQLILWILFFVGFAVKIPLPPFHLWLPEAHVEAPTSGSVLLAGIMLKLGAYGMLRFMIPLLPNANVYYSNFVHTLCAVSIIYISILAIRQLDLKKAIAYSSIAHMCFVVLGLFSFTTEGITGSIFLMLGHGIVSSALFFLVGLLYERYGTRLILNYSNLNDTMPIFSFFFFFFTLANISFPLTVNFLGELLILIGISTINLFLLIICSISIIITTIYSFWLYNRLIFNTKSYNNFSIKTINYSNRDLSKNEFIVLSAFFISTLLLGIQPNFILNKIEFLSLIYLSKY